MGEAAEFHSPGDLLATARALLASGDEEVLRASVLEAITALEAMIASTVFPLLERTLPEELVAWLEDRTRMDFDARLSVLTPVATGRSVEKGSDLWRRYKSAKRIRNDVTHLGRRVTRVEAEEVLATVDAWLHFLGATAEVTLSLDVLKETLGRMQTDTISEEDILWNIAEYYRSARGVEVVRTPDFPGGLRPDAVLRFGEELVVIEIKVVRNQAQSVAAYRGATDQALRYLAIDRVSKVAVIVVFVGIDVPEHLRRVVTARDGRISVIGVRVGQASGGEPSEAG